MKGELGIRECLKKLRLELNNENQKNQKVNEIMENNRLVCKQKKSFQIAKEEKSSFRGGWVGGWMEK